MDLSKYRQRIFNNKYDIETNNFILKCINKLNIEKGLLYNTDLSIIYDDLDKNTFDLQQLKSCSIKDDIKSLFLIKKDVFLKQIEKYEININNITTDFFLIIGLYFELFTEEEINKLSKNKHKYLLFLSDQIKKY